jgi:hypothetical protein
MEGAGSKKGFGGGRRDEEDRDRQQDYGSQHSGGNSGNPGDRRPFNPGRNAQLQYNPWHDRGRAYGGYARGWQRQQHPGYRFSGSRINTDRARAGQPAANAQCATNAQATAQRPAGDPTQQTSQATQQEPTVPEVFKNQKAGKTKVEEGSSGEGNKSFCFRCCKPGHGKLECKTKLLCDICASTEHLTRRCPILKQPRLMAHPWVMTLMG